MRYDEPASVERNVIFGENLLALLMLALGAALAVGNLMALIKPREVDPSDESLVARPPLLRTLAMIVLGAAVAVWAVGSLARADDNEQEPTADAAVTELALVDR